MEEYLKVLREVGEAAKFGSIPVIWFLGTCNLRAGLESFWNRQDGHTISALEKRIRNITRENRACRTFSYLNYLGRHVGYGIFSLYEKTESFISKFSLQPFWGYLKSIKEINTSK